MGKNVGYVRVSTGGQNVERQLAGVDLDKVFTDRCSGGSVERPALVEMLEWIREDDVVGVCLAMEQKRYIREAVARAT